MAIAPVVALKRYFGFRPGQTLQDFNEELKALSAEEKQELAEGAARELGETLTTAPVQKAA